MASLLFVLASSAATAADQVPAGGVIGVGQYSCGIFAKYDRQPNYREEMNVFAEWAQGFISAYNNQNLFAPVYHPEVVSKPIAPPDAPTILLFTRSYCEKNPLSNLMNATLSLISSLGGVTSGTVTFPPKQGD